MEAWTFRMWDKPEWILVGDENLLHWWTPRDYPPKLRGDMWTAVILVYWCIWRHCNDVVFNRVAPTVITIKAKSTKIMRDGA
jgi:hypothetical protein